MPIDDFSGPFKFFSGPSLLIFIRIKNQKFHCEQLKSLSAGKVVSIYIQSLVAFNLHPRNTSQPTEKTPKSFFSIHFECVVAHREKKVKFHIVVSLRGFLIIMLPTEAFRRLVCVFAYLIKRIRERNVIFMSSLPTKRFVQPHR